MPTYVLFAGDGDVEPDRHSPWPPSLIMSY